MIARLWPVEAVVGENGGFYFQYKNQKMLRHFEQSEEERRRNRDKLSRIEKRVLKEIPGAAPASDQFCRLFDLAIDFCEDVPALPFSAVENIKKIFEAEGATAKVSSIHVNGWFGNFDKGSTCLKFIEENWGWKLSEAQSFCCFVGDSPNDEPLFKLFPQSFGVANVHDFASQMKHLPRYIAREKEGSGFVEIAEALIRSKN
jgi:hydroxymethylpyrimidine pyrophosphatase-like HAD family hydrolase